jgi:hypothetical protein
MVSGLICSVARYEYVREVTDYLGLKSSARRQLNGANDKGLVGHGLGAYRGTIPTAEIEKDPLVSWVMDKPNLNMWSVNEANWGYRYADPKFILGLDTIATS